VADYDTNSTVTWMTTGAAPNGHVATSESAEG
jgi:hypothetical protein